MTDEEAILKHLELYELGHRMRFTSFTAALRDARGITKRNPDSGKPEPDAAHGHIGSWLGALGYLVLLDHIGTCFRPKDLKAPETGASMVRALRFFSDLDEKKIQAIYALRCCFAHDYGLMNLNAKTPTLQHCFVVTSGSAELVKFPDVPWDGDLSTKNQRVTLVDLWELGELVERMCSRLRELARDAKLEIALPGGLKELFNRFWLVSPMRPG